MNFLRNLDLYTSIVLLSLVLLPAGGFWIWKLDGEIAASKKAIDDATRKGGLLEEIGTLQRKVEVVVQNERSTSDAIRLWRTYFEGQILAAGGAALKTNDFVPNEPKEEPGPTIGKQATTDHVCQIAWQNKALTVQMDFVFAVLFNCESGARAGGDAAQQSVWKLRSLRLENATDEKILRANQTPPAELADKWSIQEMAFARREPKKQLQ
jgi:hypothetical protein